MTRWFMAALAASAATLIAGSAGAHITLQAPTARDPSQKAGPCGTAGSTRGSVVTTFKPGETITVTWQETVPHPGHYRISFDADGDDDFVDPKGFDDLDSAPSVLVDGIDDKSGTQIYSQEVTLPNITCDNCTLQLIQVMTDKPPYGDGNDIYYQCADIVLSDGSGSGGGSATGGGGATTAGAGGAGSGGMGAGAGGSAASGAAGEDGADSGGCSVREPREGGAVGALCVLALCASAVARRRPSRRHGDAYRVEPLDG